MIPLMVVRMWCSLTGQDLAAQFHHSNFALAVDAIYVCI